MTMTMTEAVRGQAIRLGKHWRSLRGAAYGLRLPPLLGEIAVAAPAAGAIDRLDAALASITRAPFEGLAPMDDPSDALAHRVMHWHVLLQQHAKLPLFDSFTVKRLGAAQGEDTGGYVSHAVATGCVSPRATEAALLWVAGMTSMILANGGCLTKMQSENARRSFADLLQRLKPFQVSGVNAFHFLHAASELHIPVQQIGPRIFCFGIGCNSRWLKSSISDGTSCLGVELAHDKLLTASILRRAGLPAPQHALVNGPEQAIQAAKQLGFPLVVKPADQEQGRGVEANLKNEASVVAAYARTSRLSKRILVEKHFEGRDYRVTVFRDRVIRVENRVAGGVTGDGAASVRELIERMQQTPRFRKALRDSGKMMIELDEEATELLAEAGLAPDDVPVEGRFVFLRRKSNISTGGVQQLVPIESAHADNLSLAVRAARALRLDIAGIDLIIPDIAESWFVTNAIICEVNAEPQIGRKNTPEIYTVMLRELVVGDGRIPVHVVVGSAASAGPDADAALRLARERDCNAVSTAAGAWIDGERIARNPGSGFLAARALLANGDARSSLCFLAADEVARFGLPVDWCETITLAADAFGSPGEASLRETLIAMIGPHTVALIGNDADA